MKKLSEDFVIMKFGFTARLVNEEDAAFIVGLRADKERTKFMVTLDDDIEKQKLWIREYKQREEKGQEYYFLYSNLHKEPVSISRISQINFQSREGKGSGWVKRRGSAIEALSNFILLMSIAFEEVGLSFFYFDVHKNNKAALSIIRKFYFPFHSFYEDNDFLYIKCSSKQHGRAKEIFKEKYQ